MSAAKIYAGADRFIESIDRPVEILAMTALMASATMLFVGAIYRYIFSSTIDLFEELSVNAVVWAVLLYGGPLAKRGGHIGMDFLSKKLPRYGQAVLQLIIYVALLFLCVVLLWKGAEIVQVMKMVGKTTHSGDMQIWILMLPVPIGASLYAAYGIAGIVKIFCAMKDRALPLLEAGSHNAGPEDKEKDRLV
jgi:TRAP-type C4-dicarboxylate transport system permease small subunit